MGKLRQNLGDLPKTTEEANRAWVRTQEFLASRPVLAPLDRTSPLTYSSRDIPFQAVAFASLIC